MEAERPRLALVGDPSVLINQINPIRPARVRTFGSVVEIIEHRRKFDTELAHARTGDQTAFVFVTRACEDHVVLDVALHLPYVARMRFENVDRQKCHLLAVLVVELIESGNLPPEGRSSIAAEDQHNGLVKGRQPDPIGFVEFQQVEVRCGVARL